MPEITKLNASEVPLSSNSSEGHEENRDVIT